MENQPEPPGSEPQPSVRPALTIVVQSWTTLFFGLVMLAFGLLAGYLGRPLLAPAPTESPTAAAPLTSTATPTAETTDSLAAQRMALMQAIIAKTRHFKGNPEAPVTLIEFSDFQ